jgi:16S rRNA (guanine527-N7)-methyltransferase
VKQSNGGPSLPVDVSRETLDRLEAFADLLLRWTRTVNLIARNDAAHIWPRHIADSLQLMPLIPPNTPRAIDLGSGAGFPGLILAIASDIPFDLVESDQRKAAFLREAVRTTGAPVRVHATRIDATQLTPAPLITARALAPVPALLALSVPHLISQSGVCLFPKGANIESELTAAAAQWHMRIERFPSLTAPDATLLRLSEISRVRPSDRTP